MIDLLEYGWDEYFEREWSKSSGAAMFRGRITADYGQKLQLVSESGELMADRPVNRRGCSIQPAVGDWVALERDSENGRVQIKFVLPRKSKFSRFAAGIEVKEQIVAANVDTVFIVQSLNRDFNMRRLERYLIAAWNSGALPVVVLSKADLCNDLEEKIAEVNNTAPGVEVHAISCVTGEGITGLRKYFNPGKTVALLGSSGVGKSTLVNTLAGRQILKTGDIRENDSRGRHTTTRRELLLLPEGGLILDTPGMRELAVWEAGTGMEVLFADIEELSRNCRFSDCKHENEPGCAVKEALESGKLDKRKWESWVKLKREQEYMEARKEVKEVLQQKKHWKRISKNRKEFL